MADRNMQGAKVIPMTREQVDSAAGAPQGGGTPGFLSRLRYAFTGKRPEEWFGPGTPIPPVAQEQAHGRQWDYPFAANLQWTPRGEQGETALTFDTLRRTADPALGGLDLIRLAIETRKDQLSQQRWVIHERDGRGDGGDRAREIEKALRRPDRVNSFANWQRMLVEDALVIDAATVYLRPTEEFGRFMPEVIDGATIKRLLGADGRTPLPPDPAYRQVIKGLPATDYTLDEVIYYPRNPRPNRFYGMSPVEQTIGIVSIALRRQLHLLNFYTEGNIPDAFVGVPPEWTPEQIEGFQSAWDALLNGNLAERRGARFVPGGMGITFTKDPKLKDELDEWLSRIICYAFGLSPQALVREMNRASSETNRDMAAQEGLEPWKQWFKEIMDEVIARGYGAEDLEWAWADEEIQDPLVKAQVAEILVSKSKIFDVDEARVEMYGKEPLTAKQKAEREAAAAPPPAFGGAPGKGGGEEEKGPGAPGGEAGGEEKPPKAPSAEEKKAAALAALVAEELKKKSFVRRASKTPTSPRPSDD